MADDAAGRRTHEGCSLAAEVSLARSRPGAGPDPAGERGSVTAEFAAALPAVLVCLALCVGAIQTGAQQARLLDHAAASARLIGRGDVAPAPPEGASRRVGSGDGVLCVTVTAPSRAGGLGALGLTVSARSCVLDDREEG